MSIKRRTLKLALPVTASDAPAPPTEFRIFTAGKVETTKGTFLFDVQAAAAVMADYEAHGIELMIDYDHASLAGLVLDPAQAGKAAGWFTPEVRAGELWATNVRWTPAAAHALSNIEWRYMSPAFDVDESGRIVALCNVALTNLPATHNLDALVAASRDRRTLAQGPSFSDVSMSLGDALIALYPPEPNAMGCGPYVVDVFDATVVFEHAGALYEVAYSFDGTTAVIAGTPAEVVRTYKPAAPAAPAAPAPVATTKISRLTAGGKSMDPKLVNEALDALIAGDTEKCAEILKGLVATAAGGEAPADPAGDTAPAGDPAAAASASAPEVAASARIVRLSGKATLAEALTEIESWRTSHVELATERAKLAKESAALEEAERYKLCRELVHLGAEFPSTVWADDAATTLKPRWLKLSIGDLRELANEQRAARGGARAPITPPADGNTGAGGLTVQTPAGPVTLSAREVAMCAELEVDPKEYAANKPAKKVTHV